MGCDGTRPTARFVCDLTHADTGEIRVRVVGIEDIRFPWIPKSAHSITDQFKSYISVRSANAAGEAQAVTVNPDEEAAIVMRRVRDHGSCTEPILNGDSRRACQHRYRRKDGEDSPTHALPCVAIAPHSGQRSGVARRSYPQEGQTKPGVRFLAIR